MSKFLTDREKIRLSAASKDMQILLYKFMYQEKIKISTIIHLPYFDNFESVEILDSENRYPKFVKHIYYEAHTTDIPPYVTHLTFGENFNQSIEYIIPPSVINLTFGWDFNQPIKNNIPPTVKHITFEFYFNKKDDRIFTFAIKGTIIGWNHDEELWKCIPPAVSNLTFCRCHYDTINKIPTRMIQPKDGLHLLPEVPKWLNCLTLSHNYDRIMKDDNPTKYRKLYSIQKMIKN